MLFNSYAFIFLFFPLCMLGFSISKKIGKALWSKAFLIFISLWFYGFLKPANVPVLLVSMAANYGIYRWMMSGQGKKMRAEESTGQSLKLPLIVGIILNLTALFFFKYTGSVFVPLGISFFTFSQIAFLMEGYRGNLDKVSVLDYGVYVTFFPKLAQGPIMLPEEMKGQVEAAVQKPFDWEQCYRSLCLFIFGLSKKVLLADTLGGAVDYGFQNLAALNSGDALIIMVSYTLRLYFDFSGYSDMAMGLSGMMGFTLPLNFKSPYKATNIVEFWKGWHITLTRFFTRYLYIPLGGAGKGKARTYLNTLIIFFVSGIWHGAGITFVVWGMMHGILYAVTRWWLEVKKEKGIKKGGKGKHLLSVAGTFLYVNAAWVFFRAPSVKEALSLFKTMTAFEFGRINWDLAGYFNLDEFWYVIKVLHLDRWSLAHYILMVLILMIALLIVFFTKTAVEITEKMKPSVINRFMMAVLLVWCIISFSGVSSFIYFNF